MQEYNQLEIFNQNQNKKILRAEKDGVEFVIKLLKFKYEGNLLGYQKQELNRMQQESFYLQSLDHPNIVKQQGYIQRQDTNEMYLELRLDYYNFDLFKFADYSFPVPNIKKIKQIFFDISQAVKYLHEVKDLVHQDIKTENICLNDQKAVLIDFEYCRSTKDMQKSEEIISVWKNRNFSYSSPQIYQLLNQIQKQDLSDEEISEKSNKVDFKKNDIFGLGVSLFCAIYFALPYKNEIPSRRDPYFKNIYEENYQEFWKQQQFQSVNQLLIKSGENVLEIQELIQGMINYDQSKRFDINQVLNSTFFN